VIDQRGAGAKTVDTVAPAPHSFPLFDVPLQGGPPCVMSIARQPNAQD